MIVADAADAVFAPAVGAKMRMLEGKIIPGVSVGAIILADRAPLPLRQVRPPAPPMRLPPRGGDQAPFFRVHSNDCTGCWPGRLGSQICALSFNSIAEQLEFRRIGEQHRHDVEAHPLPRRSRPSRKRPRNADQMTALLLVDGPFRRAE